MSYYNFDRVCSYNALFNFILTTRGLGKTYGAKKRAIKRFLKYKEKFIYLRRYKDELSTISQFFDDISNDKDFEGIDFKVKGKDFYINNELCGKALVLSISQRYKSTPFPDYTTIIFDEFIINTNNIRYLTNEVVTFLELFSTVARKRDNVRVYFLANNISYINPYFQYFNCIPHNNNRFTLAQDGEVVVEVFKDEEFNNEMYNTKFGRLIKGTTYGDYAIENKSLTNNNIFINKNKPKDSVFTFSIKNNNIELGYWVSYKEDKFYVCKDFQTNSKYRFVINKDEHDLNYTMINNINQFYLFKMFVEFFRYSKIEFSNIEVKEECYKVLRKIGVK